MRARFLQNALLSAKSKAEIGDLKKKIEELEREKREAEKARDEQAKSREKEQKKGKREVRAAVFLLHHCRRSRLPQPHGILNDLSLCCRLQGPRARHD